MHQREALPDYRIISVKLPGDLMERLVAEAKRQERSVSGEVSFRLKRSFENSGKGGDA